MTREADFPKLRRSRSEARKELEERVRLGKQLLERRLSSEPDLEQAKADFYKWHEYNARLLGALFQDDTLSAEYSVVGALGIPMYPPSFGELVSKWQKRVWERINRLEGIVEQLDLFEEPKDPAIAHGTGRTPGRKIFIIHGHDRIAALELKTILDKKGLEAILLSEEPWAGRTLIEKFEDTAEQCAFAFAIFTPDDFVQRGCETYAQMRPNVLIELGWFYGRLGREKACILHKPETELPSDLEGLGRLQFRDRVDEVYLDIQNELEAAGVTS